MPQRLQIPAQRLLPLNRLEQRLEVSLSEAPRALSLDDLVEQRRTIFDGLREDLEQIAVGIAVDQNAELLELVERLVDLADALLERRRSTSSAPCRNSTPRSRSAVTVAMMSSVASARCWTPGPAIEIEILVDLRLLLAVAPAR